MIELVVLISSYLLGSISFSYLISKRLAGIDIRRHGSNNAGATNTLRVLGKKPAIIVLLFDICKGIIPVAVAIILELSPVWVITSGLLAIIGHNWPLFFGFKGGKGVATTIGVLSTVAFFPALIAGGLAIAIIAVSKYVSLGSLVYVSAVPLVMLIMQYDFAYVLGALAIVLLAFIRHASNIKRLATGTENRLGKQRVS